MLLAHTSGPKLFQKVYSSCALEFAYTDVIVIKHELLHFKRTAGHRMRHQSTMFANITISLSWCQHIYSIKLLYNVLYTVYCILLHTRLKNPDELQRFQSTLTLDQHTLFEYVDYNVLKTFGQPSVSIRAKYEYINVFGPWSHDFDTTTYPLGIHFNVQKIQFITFNLNFPR